MANLPISSNRPQPSGNAANALQASNTADSLATEAQPAEPFAFLLAQQIGEANLFAPDTAQTAIGQDENVTDGNTGLNMKDAQDQTAANPSIASLLMQLSTPAGNAKKAGGMQATPPVDLDSFRKTAGSQNITQLLAIDHLPPEAAEHMALQSGLTQPAPNTVQATALPIVASSATPALLTNNVLPTLSTPLGNNGWAEEFSQKISWMSTQQSQVAELHLNPPNLGPLDVVLRISDNQATALFASPHGAVRDAVENALPKLRELLADNGIMLGNTTISDQSPRDRGMNEFMNQDSGTAVQHEIFGAAPEPTVLLPTATQTVTARRHNGMVDTFA